MNYKFIKPNRYINTIFLHCSATDNPRHDNAEWIRRLHINEKGFQDIGYHFFIRKDGTLETARNLEYRPAAQRGYNSGSIAICLSGLENFTEAQFFTLEQLLHKIQKAYNYRLRIRGHKEVAAKECPVFDYANVLNLVNEGSFADPEYYLRKEKIKETPEGRGIIIAASAGGVAVAEQAAHQLDLIEIAGQAQAGASIATSLSIFLNYSPIFLGIIALAALSYAFYKFRHRLKL